MAVLPFAPLAGDGGVVPDEICEIGFAHKADSWELCLQAPETRAKQADTGFLRNGHARNLERFQVRSTKRSRHATAMPFHDRQAR